MSGEKRVGGIMLAKKMKEEKGCRLKRRVGRKGRKIRERKGGERGVKKWEMKVMK